MNLQENAMDNLNRIATDILECEKCDSESLEMLDVEHDEGADSVTFTWKCKNCGHVFNEYT